MKELVKWVYIFLFFIGFLAIEHFVGLATAIAFGVGMVIKNQIDIEEKLDVMEEKEKEERELWKAILPTRKRF